MSDSRGKFVWYDLMTNDLEAAQAFYSEVLGWGTQAWEGGDMPYTMFAVNGVPLGGLMALPEEAKKMGAPPHWQAYVAVPNAEEAVAKAEELGGQVFVPVTDIPKVGRFAVVADPQGAVLSPFTPSEDSPDEQQDAAAVTWNELGTSDLKAAWKFYSELYGWDEIQTMDMGDDGDYLMFGLGKEMVGGIFNKPAEGMGPPSWLYYFNVEDLEGTIERAKSLGAQLLNGPMEVPGGDRVAQLMDPQGAAFALHWAAKKTD